MQIVQVFNKYVLTITIREGFDKDRESERLPKREPERESEQWRDRGGFEQKSGRGKEERGGFLVTSWVGFERKSGRGRRREGLGF